MKITDIRITPVAVPVKPAKSESKMRMGPRVLLEVMVEVFTDEGIVGIGESPCFLGNDLCTEILKSTRPALIGKDPTNINRLLKELYVHYNLVHLHIHSASWAFSGVEMALWDILGKRANKPLFQVWGGAYRKRIEFMGGVERQELDAMTRDAAQLAEAGYKVIYTKAGFDPEDDIAAVAAMRKGIADPRVKIRVDANQAWSTGVAINTINRMSEYGMEFVDQPVLMYNLDALKMVKDSVCVPIAGHECGWTMYDVLNAVKANAVDYLHIDGRFDVGYNGSRISAGIAEAAGIQCIHHSFFELGVSFAMNLHMIASTANCTLANQGSEYEKLEDDVLVGGKLNKQGPWCAVPEKPGIGVELDPNRMAKYHEYYMKEVYEKGFERETENHYYGAMYLRPYFKRECPK